MTAARALRELTASVEDYLKTIFELETRAGAAGTNEIAAALHIAAPSVSVAAGTIGTTPAFVL